MSNPYDAFAGVTLSDLAKKARLRLSLTQEMFAKSMGMSSSSMCWWETGMSKGSGATRVLLELIAFGSPEVIAHIQHRLNVAMKEELERKESRLPDVEPSEVVKEIFKDCVTTGGKGEAD